MLSATLQAAVPLWCPGGRVSRRPMVYLRVRFTVPGVTKWCVVTRNSELVVIKGFVALDTAYFC